MIQSATPCPRCRRPALSGSRVGDVVLTRCAACGFFDTRLDLAARKPPPGLLAKLGPGMTVECLGPVLPPDFRG